MERLYQDPKNDNQNNDLQKALERVLRPWLKSELVVETPNLKVIEIARASGKSPEKVVDWLKQEKPQILLNGNNFVAQTDFEKIPQTKTEAVEVEVRNSKGSLTKTTRRMQKQVEIPLNATRQLGLNPKRIIKDSRYESRAPGGGPVQKTKFQKQNVSPIIKARATERADIIFQEPEAAVFDVMTKRNKTQIAGNEIEKTLYQAEKGRTIKKAFEKLKNLGERNKLVIGGDDNKLIKKLEILANGEKVDFPIWNCIGFNWEKDWQSDTPKCDIVENSEESIALYYADRVKQLSDTISPLGKAEFIVLLPSDEVFDEEYKRLGLYKQNEKERTQILERTGENVAQKIAVKKPDLAKQITVTTWNDFLKKKGTSKSEKEYTKEGNRRLKSSEKYPAIKNEMLKSAKERFGSKGIKLSDEKLLAIQEAYYNMYVGEGVALEEMEQNGQNVVVVNLEEMRVPKLEYLGSNNNATIITPIKKTEMKKFYDWKNEKIAQRNKKIKEGRKLK